jgi:hypothetical protein
LTFLGFVLTSVVLFAVFYGWYWYVHRDGVYNAAKGDRLARMRGTDRLRPTSSRNFAMAEFGMIGEEEDAKPGARQAITDPHRLLPAPEQATRQRRVMPPADAEFAELPSAKYEGLQDQLPLADDTVRFQEPKQEER